MFKGITNRARDLLWWLRGQWREAFVPIEIDRPIFLVGLQGGGLTLLRRILTRAPGMVFVGGNTQYWWLNDEMQNERAKDLPDEFRLLHSSYHGEEGFWGGGWRYGADEYLDDFQLGPDEATPELRASFRAVVKDVIAKNAPNPREARFIDKSQTYGLKIPFLRELIGDSDPRFLVVTRNPYILCPKQAEKPAVSLLPGGYQDRLSVAAEHYTNCMGIMLEHASNFDSVHTIRFEDFLDDPPGVIRQCCDHAGISFDPRMMPQPDDEHGGRKWYPIEDEPNKAWMDRLGTVGTEIITEACRPIEDILPYPLLG